MELICYRKREPQTVVYDECDHDLVMSVRWHVRAADGYAYGRIRERNILLHRLLMGVTNPIIHVDHINGNPLDNRRENLRLCNRIDNAKNRRVSKTNKCGYKGVHKKIRTNHFVASITSNNKRVFLGSSLSADECARIYNYAARELHGEFAKYNDVYPLFPDNYRIGDILSIRNKSGTKGISWCKTRKKWVVTISINGKNKTVGRFEKIEAAEAKIKEVAEYGLSR